MWNGSNRGASRGRGGARGRGSSRPDHNRSSDRDRGADRDRGRDYNDGRDRRDHRSSYGGYGGRDDRGDRSSRSGSNERRWRSESRYGDDRRQGGRSNERGGDNDRGTSSQRSGQGPEQHKRKLPQEVAAVKKLKGYPQLEKAANNIRLGNEKEPSIIQIGERSSASPKLIKDIRSERSAVIFPRDIKKHPEFDQLANWQLDMSFKGVRCFSCRILNSDHRLTKSNLIFCSDQYFPACIGNKAECFPVIRIENGTFQAVKIALLCQKACGFKPEKGSVFAVGLTAYLGKVGAELFWEEFEQFSRWLEREMGGTAVPFLCPWSKGMPDTMHLNMHRGLTVFRAKYLGDCTGPQDWRFSLWLPLWELLELDPVGGKHTTTPVLVKMGETVKVIECEDDLFMGVAGEFKNAVPISVQKNFIPKLIDHLKKVAPPSRNVTFPPKHAILLGLKEVGLEPIGQGGKIPMLYLYGNSILRDAGPPLANLLDVLVKSYDAVLTYSGKRITTMLDEVPIPQKCNENDTVVVHCLGNVCLKESKYYQEDGMWHYKFPEILQDHEIDELIECIIRLQAKIRKVFKGQIKIIGPFPRILSKCCNNREHAVKTYAPFRDVKDYIFSLNHYLATNPRLNVFDVEFIPVQLIFPDFDETYLSDNIHLTEDKNEMFAEFLNAIIGRKKAAFNLLPADHPSFYTWASTSGRSAPWPQATDLQDDNQMDQTNNASTNAGSGSSSAGAVGEAGKRTLSTDSAIGQEGMN